MGVIALAGAEDESDVTVCGGNATFVPQSWSVAGLVAVAATGIRFRCADFRVGSFKSRQVQLYEGCRTCPAMVINAIGISLSDPGAVPGASTTGCFLLALGMPTMHPRRGGSL